MRKVGRDARCVAAGHVGGHALHLQVKLLQDGGGNAAAPCLGYHHAGTGQAEQAAHEAERDGIEEADVAQGAGIGNSAQPSLGAARVEDTGDVKHDEAFGHDFLLGCSAGWHV